jgi:hypothetical protein
MIQVATQKSTSVSHNCNPSTWEVEAGESQFQVSLGYIGRDCLKNPNKISCLTHSFLFQTQSNIKQV